MIEYLRGRLLERDGTHLVIDIGGVGYGVDVPLTTLAVLPSDPAGEVALFTYFHLGENIMRLYGFATREERDIFEVLLGTSGIGPKTALSILSALDIVEFARAIVRNDLGVLTKIPGVGKKTAERLALELRDSMKSYAPDSEAVASGRRGALGKDDRPPPPFGGPGAGPLGETAAALMALGCKPAVAERATLKARDILGDEAPIEELIREALKHRA